MRWFGGDGVRVFQRRRAFEREGVFIGDASYLFVPDNPRYEGSVKLLFDEHDHPISEEQYRKLKQQQPPPPPAEILIKKEATAIGEFRSWSSCTVPLSVVANRERYADGHQEIWFLIDTQEVNPIVA